MMTRPNILRLDTDGANESVPQGPQPQPGAFDPFAFIASLASPTENGSSYNWPSPATRVALTIGDIMDMAQQLQELRTKSDEFRGMLMDLNIKMEQEKQDKSSHRTTTTRSGATDNSLLCCAGMPSTGDNHSPVSTRIQNPFTQSGTTPRQSFEPLARRPSFSAVPVTPTTANSPGGPVNTHSSRGTNGRSGTRHRRTQTPTQNSIRQMMGGQPVYTFGIGPQDDRGLLTDFFDSIRGWANEWTVKTRMLTPEEIVGLLEPDSILCFFLGKNVDISALVSDDAIRCELVAAVVSNDIVYNTLCDTFLFGCDIEEAKGLMDLFNQYQRLGQGEEEKKHQLLLEQKALYTQIKNKNSHRKWRLNMSKQFADSLVEKLGVLVRDHPTTLYMDAVDRDHNLQELYIKGLRIGFRMRMNAEKWTMKWPAVGEDYNYNEMVNESRLLHGTPIKTLERLTQAPNNYSVRFAMSPTIIKSDFSTGVERKEHVHKALVHLVRKHDYIGAERSFYNAPQRSFGNGNGNGNSNNDVNAMIHTPTGGYARRY